MTRYMVLYKANPSAWPVDPKQFVNVLEGTFVGGDQLLASGALKEVGWFSPQEGYAIFEADSKDKVLGMVQPFFPYYSQEIREIVSWENAKEALLGSARMAAEGRASEFPARTPLRPQAERNSRRAPSSTTARKS